MFGRPCLTLRPLTEVNTRYHPVNYRMILPNRKQRAMRDIRGELAALAAERVGLFANDAPIEGLALSQPPLAVGAAAQAGQACTGCRLGLRTGLRDPHGRNASQPCAPGVRRSPRATRNVFDRAPDGESSQALSTRRSIGCFGATGMGMAGGMAGKRGVLPARRSTLSGGVVSRRRE
jgi:hypothetical protein